LADRDKRANRAVIIVRIVVLDGCDVGVIALVMAASAPRASCW